MAFAVLALLVSCDFITDLGTPDITYYEHVLTSYEVRYIPDTPWGYYIVEYVNADLFHADQWVDVWMVMSDGSLSRPPVTFDYDLSLWYHIIYVYDYKINFRTFSDLTGETLAIFVSDTAPADFNANDYHR